MSSPTITSASAKQRCHELSSLYQHPLLEDPPTSSAPADQRRKHLMLTREAENLCLSCPVMQQCLYNAVVRYDVAGFTGATTARQRLEIRHRLGITVTPEDFDLLAGVTARHRQVDHNEVVRLRDANPDESLETLAHRLGCSLSTVKRHLRRHRDDSGRPIATVRSLPSMSEVFAAFRKVVGATSLHRAA